MLRILIRTVAGLLAILLVPIAGFAAWDATTYDAAAWRRDYAHLKQEMSQGYANLDWIVAHRGLDLAALDAQTSQAIDGAHSRVLATLALRRFVRAFGDPHLRLVRRRASPATAESEAEAASYSPESCAADGYENGSEGFAFPFDQLAGWTPLRTAPFATGLAGSLGVLRIGAFGEDQYAATCNAVFQAGLTSRELQLAVRAQLQRELIAAIEDLRAHGAERLVVDVSGNGGGTEWVTEVVALMTNRAMSRPSSRAVAPTCDRSGIWRGEEVCPVLAPADEPAQLAGTGAWAGPLYILVDHRTGSASEDFVVWLQQNDVAVVIGERTAGAGCGYTDGGGHISLQVGWFDVRAPNCARFLADGTNEIEGIAPDIDLDMTDPDRAHLTAAFAAAIN